MPSRPDALRSSTVEESAAIRAWVEATRLAQGLGPKVEDPVVLRWLAGLLAKPNQAPPIPDRGAQAGDCH